MSTANAPQPAWIRIIPFLRPIQALLEDPDISDIMINGENGIFAEKSGGIERVPEAVISEQHLQVAARNIARALGSEVNEENPLLDSRLPDGSRVAIILSPISVGGTSMSIRKFTRRYTAVELVQAGALTMEVLDKLHQAVLQRKNILLSGGTGTGKTTVLDALARFIPDEERIVVIEDTSEIRVEKPNVVRLEARREQDGLPAVTIRDLVRQTLRLRPDRIVLGEIRGEEGLDLLHAMNTGHQGTLSTIHANSAADTLSRFATCVMMSRTSLPHRTVCANIADSLDLVVHIERRHKRRYVSEVIRVNGYNASEDKFDVETISQNAWSDV